MPRYAAKPFNAPSSSTTRLTTLASRGGCGTVLRAGWAWRRVLSPLRSSHFARRWTLWLWHIDLTTNQAPEGAPQTPHNSRTLFVRISKVPPRQEGSTRVRASITAKEAMSSSSKSRASYQTVPTPVATQWLSVMAIWSLCSGVDSGFGMKGTFP